MTNVTLKAVCKDDDFSTKFEPAALHTHKDFENAKRNISQWLDKVEAFNRVVDHKEERSVARHCDIQSVQIDLPDSMVQPLSDMCKKLYFQWQKDPQSAKQQYKANDIDCSIHAMTAQIKIVFCDDVHNNKQQTTILKIYRRQSSFDDGIMRSIMISTNDHELNAIPLLDYENGSESRVMHMLKTWIQSFVSRVEW